MRLTVHDGKNQSKSVSIHASVKDATSKSKRRLLRIAVSIHASVKDATKKTYNRWITSEVSIHASVKDATDEDGNAYKVDFVSIHASVKDATKIINRNARSNRSFNPRICKRCDKEPWILTVYIFTFQSTHL